MSKQNSREPTPDIFSTSEPGIMEDLMGGKKESNKTIKQDENKTFSQSSIKEVKQETSKKEDEKPIESKEKSTFNLSVSTLEKLEDTWISLRRKLKDKGRITKTLIVERAIELAIRDLEKNGESSSLFQNLSNQ
jgi:hypothetical protein